MTNEILYDSKGNPDIMVAFTPDELGLPAELRGRAVEAYLISKYPATLIDGTPYSMPYQQPAVNVTLDEAIELCEGKGDGWHLLTNDEWAAIALWCLKNDTMPTGNTNRGRSHSHPDEIGSVISTSYGKTLTGSGPIAWNHDHTAEGIADLVGNVWEHVGGVRFLDGQVQVIPDNRAAAGADQSSNSTEWQPVRTEAGDPVYYNVEGVSITLQTTPPEYVDFDGAKFKNLKHVDTMEVPEQLVRLGLYPTAGYMGDEIFWLDTEGDRCVYRGGPYIGGAAAGVFYVYGSYARSNSDADARLPLRFCQILWRI